MEGRKPLPTNIKLIKGTAKKSRLNNNEPKPKTDDIKMPTGMSDAAKKCWRQVSKQLKDASILTNLDTHALMLYCETYAKWQEANDKIKKFGAVIKAPSGFPVQSPYLAISNKAFDQMKAMLTEFGMTPSSRTKVSVQQDTEGSDWDSI